jgi:hypothetical protein
VFFGVPDGFSDQAAQIVFTSLVQSVLLSPETVVEVLREVGSNPVSVSAGFNSSRSARSQFKPVYLRLDVWWQFHLTLKPQMIGKSARLQHDVYFFVTRKYTRKVKALIFTRSTFVLTNEHHIHHSRCAQTQNVASRVVEFNMAIGLARDYGLNPRNYLDCCIRIIQKGKNLRNLYGYGATPKLLRNVRVARAIPPCFREDERHLNSRLMLLNRR